ncbi:MAG TPA: Ku protein, partial [Acetobacteraceae bacterium]|nr:Ku protein [Acetobacteraceae bacterium]
VDVAAIPPIYFDASYYLAPDGEAGLDVYAVLRKALAQSAKAALSRVVISRRERAVAILPLDGGMALHTLHEKRDIYDPKSLFDPVANEKTDADMVKLAAQLIDRQTAPFEPADIEDRYEERLRKVIEAKLHGEGITSEAPPPPRRDNVIDLMAALKQSLGRETQGGRKPAAPASKAPQKAAAARHRTARKRA